MSIDRTLAISGRVVRQILRDRPSLALILIVPLAVMSLVGFSFENRQSLLNQAAPALLPAFALLFTFVLTGVSFLRERAEGTLERLMISPVGRGDILLGYLLGFLLFSALQSLIVFFFTIYVFDIPHQAPIWELLLVLQLLTVVSVSLGIFVSVFANNELQVVQFIPLVFVPQVFLSGVILQTNEMPGYFQALSKVLPLTYAVRAMREMMLSGATAGDELFELGILSAYAVGLLLAAAVSVRRT